MQSDSSYLEQTIHPEPNNKLPLEQAMEIASMFAVLKDPTRIQIVYALPMLKQVSFVCQILLLY